MAARKLTNRLMGHLVLTNCENVNVVTIQENTPDLILTEYKFLRSNQDKVSDHLKTSPLKMFPDSISGIKVFIILSEHVGSLNLGRLLFDIGSWNLSNHTAIGQLPHFLCFVRNPGVIVSCDTNLSIFHR